MVHLVERIHVCPGDRDLWKGLAYLGCKGGSDVEQNGWVLDAMA